MIVKVELFDIIDLEIRLGARVKNQRNYWLQKFQYKLVDCR